MPLEPLCQTHDEQYVSWPTFGTLTRFFWIVLETPRTTWFVTSNNIVNEVFVLFGLFDDVLAMLDYEEFLFVSQLVLLNANFC